MACKKLRCALPQPPFPFKLSQIQTEKTRASRNHDTPGIRINWIVAGHVASDAGIDLISAQNFDPDAGSDRIAVNASYLTPGAT